MPNHFKLELLKDIENGEILEQVKSGKPKHLMTVDTGLDGAARIAERQIADRRARIANKMIVASLSDVKIQRLYSRKPDGTYAFFYCVHGGMNDVSVQELNLVAEMIHTAFCMDCELYFNECQPTMTAQVEQKFNVERKCLYNYYQLRFEKPWIPSDEFKNIDESKDDASSKTASSGRKVSSEFQSVKIKYNKTLARRSKLIKMTLKPTLGRDGDDKSITRLFYTLWNALGESALKGKANVVNHYGKSIEIEYQAESRQEVLEAYSIIKRVVEHVLFWNCYDKNFGLPVSGSTQIGQFSNDFMTRLIPSLKKLTNAGIDWKCTRQFPLNRGNGKRDVQWYRYYIELPKYDVTLEITAGATWDDKTVIGTKHDYTDNKTRGGFVTKTLKLLLDETIKRCKKADEGR